MPQASFADPVAKLADFVSAGAQRYHYSLAHGPWVKEVIVDISDTGEAVWAEQFPGEVPVVSPHALHR